MATLAEWISKTTPEMLQQQWLQEGHIEGLQVGLEKGQIEGQRQEQRKVIQRMLDQGVTPENIASLTGYSLEEILKQQNI